MSMGDLVPDDRVTAADDNQRTDVAQQNVDQQEVRLFGLAGRPVFGAHLYTNRNKRLNKRDRTGAASYEPADCHGCYTGAV